MNAISKEQLANEYASKGRFSLSYQTRYHSFIEGFNAAHKWTKLTRKTMPDSFTPLQFCTDEVIRQGFMHSQGFSDIVNEKLFPVKSVSHYRYLNLELPK